MRNIALQLYTVREAAQRDFIGTLKQVAAMGYKGIEAGGTLGGLPVKELRDILNDLGLIFVGGHIGVNNINSGLEVMLDDYAALGAHYIGTSWLPEDYRKDVASWQRAGRLLEKAATMCIKHDLTFFHHNHNMEFIKMEDGRYGLDILLGASDPFLVKVELDVYWAQYAGVDPVGYLKHLDGRAPLVHIKDMTADESHTFEIIGNGIIDFPAIFQVGDKTGVDWYIVEQDQTPKGEIASARESYSNIAAKGWLGK
jgi:sugar phosphate isomerase/epimerase